MTTDPNAELARFKEFIIDRLANTSDMSPEEALDLWRAENPKPEESAQTVRAIRDALAEMDAGDSGVPLDEFDRAFRRGHGLLSQP